MFESVKVITAADVLVFDEDLRDRSSPLGSLTHALSGLVVPIDLVFLEAHAFALE